MYPLGHMALAYFVARITSKSTKNDFNVFLVFLLSIFPDIDLLIPSIVHRGPTHGLLFFLFFFIPVLAFHRKWLPYVVALGSHGLIGDMITGGIRTPGVMLFWPLSSSFYYIGGYVKMGTSIEILLELILFSLMLVTFRSTFKDIFNQIRKGAL